MSEAKFTKGPWELSTEPVSEHYCLTVECGKVMRVNIITRATDIKFTEGLERIANAHLIAAAPELYAMLEILSDEFCNDSMQDEIELLLAKARGEV